MRLLFTNKGRSVLAGPITNTATTINLASGGGAEFPDPNSGEYFKLTLVDAATQQLKEIVHVTARSGDALTVIRGQEDTTALPWLAGDFARAFVTAGALAAFEQSALSAKSWFIGDDESGSANAAIVASTLPALIPLAEGQVYFVTKSNEANTGPVTLKMGAASVKNVVYIDGSNLAPGDWPASAPAMLYYTGGVFLFYGPNNDKTRYVATTGTADALVATPGSAVAALYAGLEINVLVAGSGNTTTSPTINVSGRGAKAIKRANGGDPLVGEVKGLVPLIYDGTNFRINWPQLSNGRGIAMTPDGPDLDFMLLPERTAVVGTDRIALRDASNGYHRATVANIVGKAFTGVLSTSPSGYVIFPNGLILQWTIFSGNGHGPFNVTLPIAFPNAMLNVIAVDTANQDGPGSACYSYGVEPIYAAVSQVELYSSAGGSNPWHTHLLAIGY